VLLRFDRYQERCLYEPGTGFYETTSGAGGARGEFLTSPEVGPLFGAVMARWIRSVWEEIGQPDQFDVIEVGAGRGALTAAILRTSPSWEHAARMVCVERSVALATRATDLLSGRATVRSDLPSGPIRGVVIANELLDNLCVRVVERTEKGWSEVFVELEDHSGTVSTERLVPFDEPDRLAPLVGPGRGWITPVGARLPVLEAAGRWVTSVIDRLEGRLLCVDYGTATTSELEGRPWLRTYAGHVRGTDPYLTPGSTDITIDVPFDQLPGHPTLEAQSEFLRRWGLEQLVDEGRQMWESRAGVGDLSAIEGRSRISEARALTDPTGLGGFLVAEWDRTTAAGDR